MKKASLLLSLLIQAALVLAQTKEVSKRGPAGLAGAMQTKKQYIPPAAKTNTDQLSKNACYPGLAFTVKNYGYNKDGKFYSWGVMVKNTYSRSVQLTYKLIVGDDQPKGNGTLTTLIEPGGTYSNDYGMVSAIIVGNSSDKYRIEVTGVCFGGEDCGKNGYAGCDGKQSISSNRGKNLVTGARSNANRTAPGSTYAPSANTTDTKDDTDEAEPQAKFQGDWAGFLQKNLTYPAIARENDVQGKVIVSFVVTKDGRVEDVKAISGPKELYQAAEQVIQKSNGKWTAGRQNNSPVDVKMAETIQFSLSN